MLFYLFLPELFFLFFILSSLLFSILHSKRYGIFLTSYNLKLSFTLISFFLIYLKFSLLSLTLTSFFFLLSLLLTNLIIWFIDLPRNLDETFYYFFTLFSSMFLISSINLISFYLLLELFSFSLYLLVTIGHDTPRIDTSLHYFILGSLFSCFFLLGLYFLYYTTGETNLINISLLSPYIDSRLYTLGCLLIYLSLFFKLGVSPFSLWVPTVYYGASSNVSIFLSTLPKLPLLFILYIFSNYLHTPILSFILSLSIILSLLIGSISALNVTNLKSLLAYSSINSLGFLLIPLYISNRLSLLLILYYLLIYFLSTLFIWIFMLNTNIYNIGSLRPIFFTNKFLAYSFIIALFSLDRKSVV